MRQFEEILKTKLPNTELQAIKWLIGRVLYFQKNKRIPGAINSSSTSNPLFFKPGELYIYSYDAKWKEKLPYWDAFPVVIVLETNGVNNSFLGLNLHYLPPPVRYKFFDKLKQYSKIPINENRMRLSFSYELLKDTYSLAEYVPCIKRYLVDHVRSQMMRIYPPEWDVVIHLPLAKWQKTSSQVVYRESMEKIRKKKEG